MKRIRVGVAGYGVIGQRLADGVALQKDMELVGVADVAPTLAVRALHERGMPYDLYTAVPDKKHLLTDVGIPVNGTLEDLVSRTDIMLDATSAGIGAKNKELYQKLGKKAVFQGGEQNSVADIFFHGYANYEQGGRSRLPEANQLQYHRAYQGHRCSRSCCRGNQNSDHHHTAGG